MNILCKVFQFFLNIFEQVLNVVVSALTMLGTAVVDVLSGIASAVGSALGLSGGTLLWLALGFGAWYFLSSDEEEVKKTDAKSDEAPTQ